MNDLSKISHFARGYITAALWSSTDDDGEPLDANYSASDIAPETFALMVKEADEFADSNREDIDTANLSSSEGGTPDVRAGHNFWLNRNGHGSGFWDEKNSRDPKSECEACERLDKASKAAGSRDLYAGDDRQIYQS